MVTDTVTFEEKGKDFQREKVFSLHIYLKTEKTIFSLKDVIDILKCSYDNAKMTVGRLVKKKWVARITMGKYLIIPLSAGVEGKLIKSFSYSEFSHKNDGNEQSLGICCKNLRASKTCSCFSWANFHHNGFFAT